MQFSPSIYLHNNPVKSGRMSDSDWHMVHSMSFIALWGFESVFFQAGFGAVSHRTSAES